MRLLVLGGTRFVGRALVSDALARGWDVTALTRGVSGDLPSGVTALTADRSSPTELAAALGDGEWDLVADTWSKEPRTVALSAELLAPRCGRYGYISSISVYQWPRQAGADESAPVVDADPAAEQTDYAADKRGGELAAELAFGAERVLHARAGLILGPYENVGRLPWWLSRISRGGRVVAPGRPERPLQYVDARDLAAWLLGGLAAGTSGPADITCRSGHATMGELLSACLAATGAPAELVWVPEPDLEAAGAQPWVQLPGWVPETGELAGLFAGDVTRALDTGLRCRPVEQTVGDTWEWLQRDGFPASFNGHGLPEETEAALLASR